MRLSIAHWLPALALLSLLAPVAAAAGQPEPAADARAWLARIQEAASQRNYQGTMVVSAGGMLTSTRVAHFCVGEQTYERIESLDGRQQKVLRHNDAVQTLWPQARVAVIERRTPFAGLDSTLRVVEPRAIEQYELLLEGTERVAGREAVVLKLKPRDAMRYAQRLWADQTSGLMLRADVIGPDRSVLESAAFTEIEIGVRPRPDKVLAAMRDLEGYRVVRREPQRTQLAAEGWALAREVPGFKLLGCLKRPLESAAANGIAEVVQAVFSDGLTHVSVFIEPFDAARHRSPLVAQIGATGSVMQRRGEHWITVLGDVPAPTLRLFAEALERRR